MPVEATDCSVLGAADSHFMSAALSLGWETSRCQIRAWNDSVCGVTVSGDSLSQKYGVKTKIGANVVRYFSRPYFLE